ncbi:hypothetical protein VP01_1800g5 [Puccinia sorghi]|uniref:Uncharacterized protein n=1 Tax=Puccinia sorghi TaxID=27349 RepID=A0A0L6VE77_9BASI|nr:hypothetical protein VP01_1800g5 [Puccinia sorghi]
MRTLPDNPHPPLSSIIFVSCCDSNDKGWKKNRMRLVLTWWVAILNLTNQKIRKSQLALFLYDQWHTGWVAEVTKKRGPGYEAFLDWLLSCYFCYDNLVEEVGFCSRSQWVTLARFFRSKIHWNNNIVLLFIHKWRFFLFIPILYYLDTITAKKNLLNCLQLTCRKSQEASVVIQTMLQNDCAKKFYIGKHVEFGWQLGWSMLHVNCRQLNDFIQCFTAKNLAQIPAVDIQKLPGSFCCYSNLSPRVIQPRFDAFIIHSDCAKTSTYANRWSLDDSLAGECCMSTAGSCESFSGACCSPNLNPSFQLTHPCHNQVPQTGDSLMMSNTGTQSKENFHCQESSLAPSPLLGCKETSERGAFLSSLKSQESGLPESIFLRSITNLTPLLCAKAACPSRQNLYQDVLKLSGKKHEQILPRHAQESPDSNGVIAASVLCQEDLVVRWARITHQNSHSLQARILKLGASPSFRGSRCKPLLRSFVRGLCPTLQKKTCSTACS